MQQMCVLLQWMCQSYSAVSRNGRNTDLCKCQTLLLSVVIGTQANETAVPGVREVCSKGWSCVNVLRGVDQFNLLMKVCWG